jgi:hypothetical protein
LSNEPQQPNKPSTTLIALIWALAILITQTAIYITTHTLKTAHILTHTPNWQQTGILAITWTIWTTWHKTIWATKPPTSDKSK